MNICVLNDIDFYTATLSASSATAQSPTLSSPSTGEYIYLARCSA